MEAHDFSFVSRPYHSEEMEITLNNVNVDLLFHDLELKAMLCLGLGKRMPLLALILDWGALSQLKIIAFI